MSSLTRQRAGDSDGPRANDERDRIYVQAEKPSHEEAAAERHGDAAFLESALTSGDLKQQAFVWDEASVQVCGSLAVATGRATTQGAHQGRFRATQIFVKENGAWRPAAFCLRPFAEGC